MNAIEVPYQRMSEQERISLRPCSLAAFERTILRVAALYTQPKVAIEIKKEGLCIRDRWRWQWLNALMYASPRQIEARMHRFVRDHLIFFPNMNDQVVETLKTHPLFKDLFATDPKLRVAFFLRDPSAFFLRKDFDTAPVATQEEYFQYWQTHPNNTAYYFYRLGKWQQNLKKDQPAAFASYQRAAEKKFPWALYRLGECHRDGIGTEKNGEKAAACFLEAAQLGMFHAWVPLAHLYDYSLQREPLLPMDLQKALHYYIQGAGAGNLQANKRMEELLKQFDRAAINRSSEQLFIEAAAGDPKAMVQLAELNAHHPETSAYWYKKAAKLDHPIAIQKLLSPIPAPAGSRETAILE